MDLGVLARLQMERRPEGPSGSPVVTSQKRMVWSAATEINCVLSAENQRCETRDVWPWASSTRVVVGNGSSV